MAVQGRSGLFSLNVRFKHSNSTPVEEFLKGASSVVGKKDFSKPLQILDSQWIKNVADLRLLVQEGELRNIGLPLRLCVWIEEELSLHSDDARVRVARDELQFEYQFDLDMNGILYWVGTEANTKPWQNPARAGFVQVTTSGLLGDSVPEQAVVGRESVRCVTSAQPNAWFAIDFVDKWIIPTHYTLRHYSTWDTEAIRNWRLEGSNDSVRWHLLREHVNDESLHKQGQTHTWPLSLDHLRNGFRHFRIRMTGPNSNQHLYLACSGFELYGSLSTQAPPPEEAPKVPINPAGALMFKPDHPLDTNGIVYYLATKGGTQPFVNPADSGVVSVTASSLMNDSVPLSAVVGQAVVRCVTQPQPNSWMQIDFLQKKVQPTHYMLRHYSSWDTEALRNWLFEGSEDGVNWTVLREHKDDESLNEKGKAVTWPIPEKFHSQAFQMFRVFQTGYNSNRHYYLALSGFEIYGALILGASSPAAAAQDGSTFVYHHDFDGNGIIEWIGTRNGTQQWTNPADAKFVSVSASSVMTDSVPMSAVVGHDVVRCVTKPHPNSWIAIDLISYAVQPTHYTLRHYSSWDVEALRNWNFEGSNDGATWTILSKHVNDEHLNAKGATYTWPLNAVSESYRHFRILQWGINSNKHNYLSLSGFELYGRVTRLAAPAPAVAAPMNGLTWDVKNKSAFLEIDEKTGSVRNQGSSDKWQMARTVQSFGSGKVHFAVKIVNDAYTTNTWRFIIGVIPSSFPASGKEWVGAHGSWGYIGGTGGKCHQVAKSLPYNEAFGGGDVVGIDLDFDRHTIEFFKNGVSQDVAFRNLAGPVQLAISFTGAGTVIAFADDAELIAKPIVSAPTTWDPAQKSRFIDVDAKAGTIVNKGSADKWQSVRSVRSFSRGKCQFSVEIVDNPATPNNWRFIVGVVPASFPLTWVGASESWGYIGGTGGKCYNVGSSTPYGAPYGKPGDVITVKLDFEAKTIEFLRNDESQGVAFDNLVGPVYAAVSVTATGAKVRLKDVQGQ